MSYIRINDKDDDNEDKYDKYWNILVCYLSPNIFTIFIIILVNNYMIL